MGLSQNGKILSLASFFLKKEKTEIKSRQNGIIEL